MCVVGGGAKTEVICHHKLYRCFVSCLPKDKGHAVGIPPFKPLLTPATVHFSLASMLYTQVDMLKLTPSLLKPPIHPYPPPADQTPTCLITHLLPAEFCVHGISY